MSSSRRHGGKALFDDTAEQRANVVVNPQQTVPKPLLPRVTRQSDAATRDRLSEIG